MNTETRKKEVDSWNWNLGPFEIYDRMKEALEYGWHFEECTKRDIGIMLGLAQCDHRPTGWCFADMCGPLDNATHKDWGGVQNGFDEVQDCGHDPDEKENTTNKEVI